ncbi:MAG: hypothetical protein AAF211_04445 [Myxococcota bacterium]
MSTVNLPDPSRHLSTLQLHQLRNGELDAAEARAAQQHLDECELCAARLRHQSHVRAEFLLRPMPEVLRQPDHANTPWWRWLAPLGIALAALGLVALRAPDPEGIRTRGVAPTMEVWVATEDGPRLLREDERLGEGDRVAIKYDAKGASHVGFAGRDSRGLVEVYGVYQVPGDGLVNAPFGLELDDAPGDQELFVVTGDAGLDVDRVKEAIRSDVHMANGDGSVECVVVAKRERMDR